MRYLPKDLKLYQIEVILNQNQVDFHEDFECRLSYLFLAFQEYNFDRHYFFHALHFFLFYHVIY